MTQATHAGGAVDEAMTDTELVENIRRVVRALQALRGIDTVSLAASLGIERNTLYSRMGSGRESRFSVPEIYRMARLFDVPASVFFDPAEDLLGGIGRGFRKAPFLTPVPDGDADDLVTIAA